MRRQRIRNGPLRRPDDVLGGEKLRHVRDEHVHPAGVVCVFFALVPMYTSPPASSSTDVHKVTRGGRCLPCMLVLADGAELGIELVGCEAQGEGDFVRGEDGEGALEAEEGDVCPGRVLGVGLRGG